MKRAHRTTHRWLWLLLVPILVIIAWAGFQSRNQHPLPLNLVLPESTVKNSLGDAP